ncbi:hypothetical protein L6164_007738 [Bauhinia variegata]|uniref:Uncharacterized protein n=1 Tax=Bauhinia variegata TaxID=167791 RepID=A0ACB9PEA5_BAUVA|nr:hypothetical protein L6164_007738 [Bauhinia variegata]
MKPNACQLVTSPQRLSLHIPRKKNLAKKVEELSALCGIDACAIKFSPYDSQPEVWPSPTGVQNVMMARLMEMPEMQQKKKMMSQEDFLSFKI